jgi:hypothetical protein
MSINVYFVAESVQKEEGEVVDYTKIPIQLEQKFEEFDENNALRPTIISPGDTWNKTYYKSLLSEAEKKSVDTEVFFLFFIYLWPNIYIFHPGTMQREESYIRFARCAHEIGSPQCRLCFFTRHHCLHSLFR